MEAGNPTSQDEGRGVGGHPSESRVVRNRADSISCTRVSAQVDGPVDRAWRWKASPHSYVAENARGSHASTVFSIHPTSDDSVSRLLACSPCTPRRTTSFPNEERDQVSFRDGSRARARGSRREQDLQAPFRMRGKERRCVRGGAGVVRRDLVVRHLVLGRKTDQGSRPESPTG